MNDPKTKRQQLSLLFIGLMGWFLGILLLLILTAQLWIPTAAPYFAKDQVEQLEFEVDNLSITHTSISNLAFQNKDITLNIPNIQFSYQPSDLLNKKVRTLISNEPTLKIKPSFFNQDSEAPDKKTSINDLLNQPIPSIPFHEALINDYHLEIEFGEWPLITLDGDFSATQTVDTWIADLQTNWLQNKLRLNAKIDETTDSRMFEISLDIPDIIESTRAISSSLPTEINQLVDDLAIESKSIFANVNWNNENDKIELNGLLSALNISDKVSLDTLFIRAESNDFFANAEGNFSISTLTLPDLLETKLEGEWTGSELLSTTPSFHTKTKAIPSYVQIGERQLAPEPFTIEIDYKPDSLDLYLPALTIDNFALSIADTNVTYEHLNDHVSVQINTAISLVGNPIQMNPFEEQNIRIRSNLQLEHAPSNAYHFDGTIMIPDSSLNYLIAPQISLKGNIAAQIELSGDQKHIDAEIHSNFTELNYSFQEESRLQFNGNLHLSTKYEDPFSGEYPNPLARIEQFELNSSLQISGDIATTPFSINELVINSINHSGSEPGISLHGRSPKGTWDDIKLLNLDSTVNYTIPSISTHTTGYVVNETLSAEVDYIVNIEEAFQEGLVSMKTSPNEERSSINIKDLFPHFQNTFISGLFSAILKIKIEEATQTFALEASLTDGTVTLPDNGIAVTDIQIPQFQIHNLLTGQGSERQEIHIGSIQIPPTEIKNLKINYSPLKDFGLMINHLQFEFCEGLFEISMNSPVVAPYDTFDLTLKFTGLELSKLTQLIPDFKEDLSGKIEGYLPVSLKKGAIQWKEGKASLMKGTTATLRYNEDGVIAQYMPEIELSKKINIDVNDALKDMTLTQLEFDIRSSKDFENPTIVIMSGHSNNPNFNVPIERIQLNIRAGDVPALLNRSFNATKWIDSVILGK